MVEQQQGAVYEPPMLVEVGDFAEWTRGFGFAEFDAFDYFSSFFWGW
ncbi:MAG: lasso RiPP family leader peptide-containing protein [Egibacteraceae bacterium]